MAIDNRRHQRRTVNIAAKLAATPDGPLRDCVVIDISEGGARLEIDPGEDAPQEFIIVFGPSGHPCRQCRVVWRANKQVGVAFCKTA